MASIAQTPGVPPHLLSQVNQLSVADSAAPTSQLSKPRDVTTTLHYFKDPADGGPPHPTYVSDPSTYERETDAQQAIIHDIRGTENQYTLDTTGFQIVQHTSTEKDFLDDDKIKSTYYAETEELLKKATGASKVFIFDHTIRRQAADSRTKVAPATTTPTTADNESATTGPVTVPVPQALRGPVQRVHIDQSYAAAPDRVTYHLPDEAETLLKGRFQIINVWRPIKTILKDPLGVAAANSVNDDELVPIKLIYPHRSGETYSVRPARKERTDGGHKWHYLFKQSPDEVTLIKCFDSKTDGRARRVPHSAFIDEEWNDEAARESIEVRTLVFHPDDTE